MFFSTLGFLSDDSLTKLPYDSVDGEGNSDYKSTPGSRGGPASAGCWGGGRLSRKRRVQCSNNKRQFDPDFKVLVWLQRKDKEKG